MNILFETDKLKIETQFEAAFLIEKSTNEILLKEEFYGDPSCCLIDENNEWAILAGEYLTIWTPGKWVRLDDQNLKWIHSIRKKGAEKVEVLTDPWNVNSAIWEINIRTFLFKKVEDFNNYKDKEYSEVVIW